MSDSDSLEHESEQLLAEKTKLHYDHGNDTQSSDTSQKINDKKKERQRRYREQNREKLKQREAERRKRKQNLQITAEPSTSSNVNRIELINEKTTDADAPSLSGLEGTQTYVQENEQAEEKNALQKKRERQQRYREQNREKLKQREAERRQRRRNSEIISEAITDDEIISELQRKWKSLRDCFKREHVKQARIKRGSASASRKPYIYYKQLSFLLNVADTKRRARSPADEEDGVEIKKTKKTEGLENNEENEIDATDMHNNISEHGQCSKHEDDADRNFAMSLVPHFKRIPIDLKLDAQADILMVLRKYKQYMEPPQNQHIEFFAPLLEQSQSFHALHPSTSEYPSAYLDEFTQPSSSPVSDTMQSVLSDDSSIHEKKIVLEDENP